MKVMLRPAVVAALLISVELAASPLRLQSPAGAAAGAMFDAVSIKRNTGGVDAAGGMRSLPDGSFRMTNQLLRSIILFASPVPVDDVEGLPDWTNTERYDVNAKAPAGSTRAQQGEMIRNMLIERMKLVAQVEDRERSSFALVLARKDGRLGPQLTRVTFDCAAAASSLRPQASPPPPEDPASRCGIVGMGAGSIVSSAIDMDQFARALRTIPGEFVNNRTGLKGWYSVTLQFTPLRSGTDASSSDDAPGIFTALQEQLGLKLQPEKAKVPVFVVAHIERPTEN